MRLCRDLKTNLGDTTGWWRDTARPWSNVPTLGLTQRLHRGDSKHSVERVARYPRVIKPAHKAGFLFGQGDMAYASWLVATLGFMVGSASGTSAWNNTVLGRGSAPTGLRHLYGLLAAETLQYLLQSNGIIHPQHIRREGRAECPGEFPRIEFGRQRSRHSAAPTVAVKIAAADFLSNTPAHGTVVQDQPLGVRQQSVQAIRADLQAAEKGGEFFERCGGFLGRWCWLHKVALKAAWLPVASLSHRNHGTISRYIPLHYLASRIELSAQDDSPRGGNHCKRQSNPAKEKTGIITFSAAI